MVSNLHPVGQTHWVLLGKKRKYFFKTDNIISLSYKGGE